MTKDEIKKELMMAAYDALGFLTSTSFREEYPFQKDAQHVIKSLEKALHLAEEEEKQPSV